MVNYISIEDAAARLASVERIMVIGCSGGGKSTLSKKIVAHFDLHYISMDRDFYWLPGWVKRDKADERRLIAEAVAGGRWLMDGTGPSTFDLRVPRAEMIIWVRVPRWQCIWGVISRGLRYAGETRPEMAPGCVEKFPDREFLSYIWTFERKFSPAIIRNIDLYGPEVPVVVLKSRREIGRLTDLAGIAGETAPGTATGIPVTESR